MQLTKILTKLEKISLRLGGDDEPYGTDTFRDGAQLLSPVQTIKTGQM